MYEFANDPTFLSTFVTVFLIVATLMSMKLYLIVFSSSIPLMIDGTDVPIGDFISSLKKYLFKAVSYF